MSNVVRKTGIRILLCFLALNWLGCSESPAAEEGPVPPGLLELDSFLTNISDPSGERYCKLGVKLAIAPADKVAAIKDDPLLVARIRDQILTSLTAKTFPELAAAEGKEVLRQQIQEEVGRLLQGCEIRQVLFSEFVVQ
jgi:flagellar FliL protein